MHSKLKFYLVILAERGINYFSKICENFFYYKEINFINTINTIGNKMNYILNSRHN